MADRLPFPDPGHIPTTRNQLSKYTFGLSFYSQTHRYESIDQTIKNLTEMKRLQTEEPIYQANISVYTTPGVT